MDFDVLLKRFVKGNSNKQIQLRFVKVNPQEKSNDSQFAKLNPREIF